MASKKDIVKHCSNCNKEKLMGNYEVNQNKTGRFYCDMKCKSAYHKRLADTPEEKERRKKLKRETVKRYIQKNPEKVKAAAKRCRPNHKEQAKEYQKRKSEELGLPFKTYVRWRSKLPEEYVEVAMVNYLLKKEVEKKR